MSAACQIPRVTLLVRAPLDIDLAAARDRGIVVSNGAGTNADCVADHVFALLLPSVRQMSPDLFSCNAALYFAGVVVSTPIA